MERIVTTGNTSGGPVETNHDGRGKDVGDEGGTVEDYSLQLRDEEIMAAQRRSKFTKKRLEAKTYLGQKVEKRYGLMTVATKQGWRVVLPPTLWTTVFKDMHCMVWSGHLRGPHTYGGVAQLYWWSNLRREANGWVRGCRSRKVKPREVVPPLRSIHGGDVCDRWALDVAGPFPVANGGDRYVVAAVVYVTRYAVARCVKQHTAENVAAFLMEEIVLKFGTFRELLTDGAPEMAGKVVEVLVDMLQARQVNPGPYRPHLIGPVERFHRSWKDWVATFMGDERQNDWDLCVRFAVYSYNSARHSTVTLSPNELMMGRRMRPPNELLRQTEVTVEIYRPITSDCWKLWNRTTNTLNEHDDVSKKDKQDTTMLEKFEKNVVSMWEIAFGFTIHRVDGPLRNLTIEPAGYDTFLLRREDKTGEPETVLAHVSFLVSYHFPETLLQQIADDIDKQLRYKDQDDEVRYGKETAAPVRAAASAAGRTTGARGTKRGRSAVVETNMRDNKSGYVVERRRRRQRNRAGQYVLQYEL
ncbi:Enzymatic Polyprotein [Phytophthora megakarya]|uniref:Enzymatic Polyprotein n=1 Tax=Phytophthora megakarya TaxID=4795 RepID=A0A225UPP9_9STRA|nr:Enzymatic Polyprotein [Phytophthora megakarya]